MDSISNVMIRDHDKILKLLNGFGNCIGLEKQILKKAFETFNWELEKHIFTEEKSIFISYESKDYEEGYKMVPRLMKDHDIIYDKLKVIRKNINFDESCNFEEFKDFLLKHKDFEESSFYPLLDEWLDENTKKIVIDRINEIKITVGGLKNIKINCSECGKKIGILKSYHHPMLEKRWFLCSECYDKI